MTRPTVIKNVRIIDPSRDMDETGTIVVKDGRIAAAGKAAQNQGAPDGAEIVDGAGLVAAPGLVDARVFVGEPGAEHRETLESASRAAASGGITTFIMMPDTDPVIDDIALVEYVLKTARDKAQVHVHPAAALTKGLAGNEMTEFGLLREAGAVAFTHPLNVDRLKSMVDAIGHRVERAGKIAGGPPEFFIGEHRRMLEFLARFAATLGELKEEIGDPARRVIRLLDEEAAFKSLCEHHDMREGAIFFPALDRVTDEEERRELIGRCFAANLQLE